ncbi:uncharacterized protein LOC110843933 isoform X2 [Folsomia candida]|uniref:uncharacterized protein LOC110843933 isoform X2 n=1 Tax=Folsomia candida TaxID=158441 RepID=UPI000B8F1E92|nr:uncharacterized protein LOC110843933 isoform X2 [Folsomia candida]
MFSKSKLFIALAIYCGIGHISALEDGDFYKITLSSNGKVLTVGGNGVVDGADIILTDWNNEPNQKWLAVQAVVAGDNYLLLPQQQRWNWLHFLRNGEALRETKERHNNLPDWSLVLNGDTRGEATVQPRDSKKYQQWRSENSGSNSKVIIKNLQDNKCLQAPGIFSSSSEGPQSTTSSNKVTLAVCDKSNAGQQWTLEKISIR